MFNSAKAGIISLVYCGVAKKAMTEIKKSLTSNPKADVLKMS